QLGSMHGFALREQWWLRVLLHEGLRGLAMAAYLYVLMGVWLPLPGLRRCARMQRIEMLCGITLSLLLVSSLKSLSLTSCPWDLVQFGGMASYVPHWLPGVSDGGPGRCFPSGHASAGFAFLSVAAAIRTQTLQRRVLITVLLFGVLCAVAQVLRGAHYPSHVLWTAWLCAVIALLNHGLFEWLRKKRRPVPAFAGESI
ncbi:MAG: phosphatase PAP2 family protein, partial [Burkholderiales bacterium]|nr:phosphatase PAP2 family protein [Burkholderiales bacterium]